MRFIIYTFDIILRDDCSKSFSKFALENKYNIDDIDDFCDMSTLTLFMIVCLAFTIRLIFLSCMKLLVQTTIYVEIRLFLRLCNSFSRETWSYASTTFMLNNVAILSLLIFQIVWICFVSNFKIVSQLRFLRSFIWQTKKRSWVFVKSLMRRAIIDFKILSKMFKRTIDLYVLTFV
jgi:hypothetical protein